jgi:heme exporter protein C
MLGFNSVKQNLFIFILAGLVILLMTFNLFLIFIVAPTDAVLGDIQRIFYIHVPIAVISFVAFFVVFIGSIMYLIRRTSYWDRLAHSAAEVGVVFVTITLLTGVVWARPVWGVWWTWEPRLTTTLILWLIYVAYLMVRSYAPSQSQGSLYAAAIGIVGFVDVPIVYYSVQWWRSIHPVAVVGPLAEAGSLEPIMRNILVVSLITFMVVFVWLLQRRMAIQKSSDTLTSISHLSDRIRV